MQQSTKLNLPTINAEVQRQQQEPTSAKLNRRLQHVMAALWALFARSKHNHLLLTQSLKRLSAYSPCTDELAEVTIPSNLSAHGYVEPAEDVARNSGLLIARLFIAEDVAAKGIVKLWIVNLHGTPVTLHHGHVALIRTKTIQFQTFLFNRTTE
jgi:hypothetical protein